MKPSRAWMYVVPTCVAFQPCSICVDKLGVSIKPLAPATTTSPECGRMTDLLNFPSSSIVDVAEGLQFSAQLSEAQPALGPVGLFRRALPFARALFSARCDSNVQLQQTVAEPPVAHTVRMRVRPALAGTACMQEQQKQQQQQQQQKQQQQQPICIWLCFSHPIEAQAFVAKVTAYKKHAVAITLLTYIKTLAVLLEREDGRGYTAQMPDCSSSGAGHAHAPSEPAASEAPSLPAPPLPRRPSNLPPPSLLPRIINNE